MQILVVCNYGKNRSAYLARYLQEQNYVVQFGGIQASSDNPVTAEMVAWSDLVIFVQPQIRDAFLKIFPIQHQHLITLDVEDRVEFLKAKNPNQDWLSVQKEYVYPELRQQLEYYLPLRLSR